MQNNSVRWNIMIISYLIRYCQYLFRYSAYNNFMKFAELLQNLLVEYGISQAELSRETGIPKTTVSGWMKAGRLPDYNSIRTLCQFFDISADELLQLKKK